MEHECASSPLTGDYTGNTIFQLIKFSSKYQEIYRRPLLKSLQTT